MLMVSVFVCMRDVRFFHICVTEKIPKYAS